ncbi:MAG: hypothetical protein N2037_14575, partial [Acidimicrobiales bacterium]|nr:hypothetical protein [Acidimicrobiales bacterium]
MARWSWEEVNVNHSGSAGDVSKLFRNEGVKEPGVLAIDAPQADATVLAREAIQNSWDAAREVRRHEGSSPFVLRFIFRSFEGAERDRLVDALGLRELAERAASCERRDLGLADKDFLTLIDTASPLG